MSGKQYVVIISVLLVVLVLFNLPTPESLKVKAAAHDNLAPFTGVVEYLVRHTRGVGWYVAGAWRAPGTEADLRAENAQLQRELWRMRGVQAENASLRELVALKQQGTDTLLCGEVVARGDATGWWKTVRINRGRRDGVKPDLPVITSRGLVGRLTSVAEQSAEVLLISDPLSQVSCRVGADGALGLLRGGGDTATGDPRLEMLRRAPEAKLEYLPAERAVPEGEAVFTSGLGGVFPEGIPVGTIRTVRLDPSQLYMEAVVVPAADLTALRYVFVVLGPGRGAMTWVIMFFGCLGAAFVQLLFPAPTLLGQVKWPLLLLIVIYYALHRETEVMVVAAVMAGFLQDALSGVPLGLSCVLLAIAGWSIGRFRDLVVSDAVVTQAFFGLVGGAGTALGTYVLLRLSGTLNLPALQGLHKIAGIAVEAALCTPLVFLGMGFLDQAVGNTRQARDVERIDSELDGVAE